MRLRISVYILALLVGAGTALADPIDGGPPEGKPGYPNLSPVINRAMQFKQTVTHADSGYWGSTGINNTTLTGVSFSYAGNTPNGFANSGANSNITSLTGLTTPLGAAYGGTGVANNSANTITFSGNYGLTFTLTGTTGVTLPTSGTLAILGANTFTGIQTFADSGTWSSSGISGTTINNSTIGATTASSGKFTTITASTSVAIAGCTIGSNALCATGTANISGNITGGSSSTYNVELEGGSSYGLVTSNGDLDISATGGIITLLNQTVISLSSPYLELDDTSQGSNLKIWQVSLYNGNFQIQAWNDALSANTGAYVITRGTTYNVSQHNWYTSTTAGTSVLQMTLNSSGQLQVAGASLFGTASTDAAEIEGGSSGVTYTSNGGTSTFTAATTTTLASGSGAITIAPSSSLLTITGSGTTIELYDSSQGTNLKPWAIFLSGGAYEVEAANDAFSAVTTAYIIGRGTTYNVAYHEFYTSSTAGTAVVSFLINTATGSDFLETTAQSAGALLNTSAGILTIEANGGSSDITAASAIHTTGVFQTNLASSVGFEANSTDAYIFVWGATSSTYDNFTIQLKHSDGSGFINGLKIDTSGVVYFPNIANVAGNEILCFDTTNGPVSYENAVAGCVPSDPTLKNKGSYLAMSDSINKIMGMHPATYSFKPETHFNHNMQIGLYADDVCAADSMLCITDKKGIRNYDKIALQTITISAVQFIRTNQEVDEAKLASVQTDVAWLKSKVH